MKHNGCGTTRFSKLTFVVALALVVALPAAAQSGTAKQAENLKKAADDAQGSLQKILVDFKSSLATYNEIIEGDASKRQSNYKKLVSGVKSSEKQVQSAQKSVDSLSKQADKFFKSWEKDIQAFSSDDMKVKSEKQLESTKAKYAKVGELVRQASEEFKPLAATFNDQVLYLGRDLSDGAIEEIKPDAEKLNAQAEEVFAKIDELMQSADQAEDAAEDTMTDTGSEDDAADEAGDDAEGGTD